jgi:hypothetical protein
MAPTSFRGGLDLTYGLTLGAGTPPGPWCCIATILLEKIFNLKLSGKEVSSSIFYYY